MEYEKIIVDMLNRICVLEEQVKKLSEMQSSDTKSVDKQAESGAKTTTADIRKYILGLKAVANSQGEEFVEIVSNDVHRALKLTSSMPSVCNAMRQVMREGDIIVHQTPSGNSSTLKIKYFLK